MKEFKYVVSKKMEIAGCHKLDLPYDSPCTKDFHGHNWLVTVYVGANDKVNGMVIDFMHIKKKIHNVLDHHNFNNIFDFNPTAENIAEWIAGEVNTIRQGAYCIKVKVQESEGNIAIYNALAEI